jgi:6-phosphofructokinase 1
LKIGILTAGGDCPGLNAAIRGVGKAAILEYGMEVRGFMSGFTGLIRDESAPLDERSLSGILTTGGTILGTSREKPFKEDKIKDLVKSKPETIVETYRRHSLDCLVCIGGNGTMKTAFKLSKLGLNVVGMPKTIDNDVWGTDASFGFDSALGIVSDALDKIHTTANSHRRIMVTEVMGHQAGWLALYAGIAGGGDVILIPEIAFDPAAVAERLLARANAGKPYSIVVVAEGIARPDGEDSAGRWVAKMISERTGIETRETILGYIQRGGSPSPFDRILATRLGTRAAKAVHDGDFGTMVALRDGETIAIPLSEVAGRLKTVPADSPVLSDARSIGTSFGETASRT